MPTVRIPLVGSILTRNDNPWSSSSKDQMFINCYPELDKNPITGTTRSYLYKRQGTSTAVFDATATSCPGACIKFAASSPTIITSFQTGSSTSFASGIGGFSGSPITSTVQCFHISETVVSGASTLFALVQVSSTLLINAYVHNGTWSKVSDVDFPLNASSDTKPREPAHMDGYTFYIDSQGRIWNSDLNDPTSWNATSFITAQTVADEGVALARYRNMIVAFGTASIEFFRNSGNAAGSVLEPIPQMARPIGAAQFTQFGSPSISRPLFVYGDNVYWIGRQAVSGEYGIYRFNGYEPQKISTPAIDRLMNQSAPSGTQRVFHSMLGVVEMHSMSHIMVLVSVPTATTSVFAYCIELGLWWQWSGVGVGATASFIASMITTGTNGNWYNPTQGAYSDASTTFTATVQTELLDFGTQKNKFFRRIRPVCDLQSTTSLLSVSYAEDDSWSYNTATDIDLSSQTAINDGLTNLGMARRRSFKLTHSSSTTPLRLEAIEVTYDLGRS